VRLIDDTKAVDLDPAQCRLRQLRFARLIEQADDEYALLCRPEHVQYFTGFRPAVWLQALVVIWPDGRTLLCTPNEHPPVFQADEVVTYEAQWNCTLRQDQLQAALVAVTPFLSRGMSQRRRIAVEGSMNPGTHLDHCGLGNISFHDIEPLLWKLRRKKDPDELRMIRKSIDCTEAMYRKAREIIHHGITEIEVYNQLAATAVSTAGEPLTSLGNDFQCNSPGGAPRCRPVQKGEIYILDLGPACRGYFADNCRAFLVDASPTDEQYQAWRAVVDVLNWAEQTIRPGVSARQLFLDAKLMLDTVLPGGFFHHLGHGIGLFPHEAPHLNNRWDETFEVGDVFTVEPGLYAPHLKGGIRLEQNYLVTEAGIQHLTHFPLELN